MLCLLFVTNASAQVTMAVQVPPAGVMQQSQLWNMMLVNAATNTVSVRIMLRLTDAGNAQPVLTAVTRSIPLSPGGRQLQLKDINPVQYEYLSPVADRRENGLLAPGNYVACYSVMIDGDKSEKPAVEDCIPFTVEPVSPPLLNTPEDTARLETRLPQFSWLPPAPLNLFTDLNYELRVVEVRADQSAAEAIQQNIPVYIGTGLRNPVMTYPSGAVALDTGRTYAWMVIANNGRLFAAQTEVWTFSLKDTSIAKTPDDGGYVLLKREIDGVMGNCSGALKCIYVNDPGDDNVRYEIIALDDENQVAQSGSFHLSHGDNRLELQLGKGRRLAAGKHYTFVLYNSRNEQWRMNFAFNPIQQ